MDCKCGKMSGSPCICHLIPQHNEEEITRLTKQRDELVAALENLLTAVTDKYVQMNTGLILGGPAIDQAREVLTNIKEQK